jgi:hypothetical protein
MSENVGAATSHSPKSLHGLHRDSFTFNLRDSILGHVTSGLLRIKGKEIVSASSKISSQD